MASLANFESALQAIGAPIEIQTLDNAYKQNSNIRRLVDAIGISPESAALHTGDTTSFITAIDRHVLNRDPLKDRSPMAAPSR